MYNLFGRDIDTRNLKIQSYSFVSKSNSRRTNKLSVELIIDLVELFDSSNSNDHLSIVHKPFSTVNISKLNKHKRPLSTQ